MKKDLILGVGALLLLASLVFIGVSIGLTHKVEIVNPLEVNQGKQEVGKSIASTNWEVNNGEVIYHLSGTFIDASTTIVSFANPFLAATSSAADVVISGTWPNGYTGATSTVDLMRLNITGVSTSTFNVYCASAPTAYATSSLSYNLMTSDTIATSTKGVIENNIASTYNMGGYGGGSVAKIVIGPSTPYVICKVYNPNSNGDNGGFTGDSNTFDGTWVAQVRKNQ